MNDCRSKLDETFSSYLTEMINLARGDIPRNRADSSLMYENKTFLSALYSNDMQNSCTHALMHADKFSGQR